MTDKEILERIASADKRSLCVCYGVNCNDCLDAFGAHSMKPCRLNNHSCKAMVKQAKQKLKEMECEMCEIPELKGVKMLVSDDFEDWIEAEVIGEFKPNKPYIILAIIDNTIDCFKHAKPLPKPWEIPPEGYRIVTEEEDLSKLPCGSYRIGKQGCVPSAWFQLNHDDIASFTYRQHAYYVYAVPLDFSFEPEEMTVAEICNELGREIKVKKG